MILICMIGSTQGIYVEYYANIQECLYCNDGNPLNKHRFCQKDYGFPLCQPSIVYLEEYCPDFLNQVPNREECFSFVDYFRDCNNCTANGGYYCPRNAKCYAREVLPEIFTYCNQYVASEPFCQEEDPNNGCKYQNQNIVDEEIWERATRTNAREINL